MPRQLRDSGHHVPETLRHAEHHGETCRTPALSAWLTAPSSARNFRRRAQFGKRNATRQQRTREARSEAIELAEIGKQNSNLRVRCAARADLLVGDVLSGTCQLQRLHQTSRRVYGRTRGRNVERE